METTTAPRARGWLVAAAIAVIVVCLVVIVAEIRAIGHQEQPKPRLAASCHSDAPRLSVLMIGNSYTSRNDLPNVFGTLMCDSAIATNVQVEALTLDGASLHDWVGSGARTHLDGHDVVVLQEQSETPGLGGIGNYYAASLTAIDELSRASTAAHVHVVLFETWAHENGDPANQLIYPTYDVMQSRIDSGYARYLAWMRAGPAPDAHLSPVGRAWAWVHSHDPSLFNALYLPDGSHPSMAGTYLAALVLAATVSDRDLPEQVWKPSQLPAAQANALQAAARTV